MSDRTLNADETRPAFREPFPIFAVRDLPASITFFQDALGFEAGYQWPTEAGPTEVEFIVLALDGASLGLGRGEAGAAPTGAQLCIEVDDVHAAWDWALAQGATAVTPPARERWNEWSAFLHDPSGLRIMLYARNEHAPPDAPTSS